MPFPGFASRPASLLLLALAASTTALDFDLCASFNTATTGRNSSDLQSNGLCRDFCVDDYAYAITQEFWCWCSNYTPDESVELSDSSCSITCPGYPYENCGGPNAYGYIALNRVAPSGTRGPEDVASSTTTTTTSSQESTTSAPPPPTSVETQTHNGVVTTVTIISTNSAGAAEGNTDGTSPADGGGGGLGTGAIAGIVVGVIGAVLIAAGLILFWFLRRRKQNQNEAGFQPDPSANTVPGSASASTGPQMGMTASTPISATGSGTRRNSSFIDPRMDPFKQGLYARNHSNESLNTIRDDHDYSRRIQQPRVLRATNPDPDAE